MPEHPSAGQASPAGSGRGASTGSGQGAQPALRPGMLMRITVPAQGHLRNVAGDVGAKIAESLGSEKTELASIAAAIEGLARTVAAPGDPPGEITFEFHAAKGELVVHARCDGRSSETRHRLPA